MSGTLVIVAAATLVLSWLVWSTAVMVAAFEEALKRERERGSE